MRQENLDDLKPSSFGILLMFLLITVAVVANFGSFRPYALLLMLCAMGFAVWLHFRPEAVSGNVEGLLLGLVIAFIGSWVYARAGQYESVVKYDLPDRRTLWWAPNPYAMGRHVLSAIAFIAALTYLWQAPGWKPRLRRYRLILLVAIAVISRGLMLPSSPLPVIDVFVSQTAGAKGLLLQLAPESQREEMIRFYAGSEAEEKTLRKSLNVYAMEFPSPYTPGATFDHYAYPPPTVYANALGWWAFKDVRTIWILCDLIGALCIYLLAACMSPGPEHRRFRELLTLTFLFMPRSLFVLEQSWTEPLVVASLGVFAVLLARPGHALWRGIAMAFWFGSKQYVVLAAPLVLKLRRCKAFTWTTLAVVGLALFLPFMLWNWDALYHDLVGFFVRSPGRPDALSICGAVKHIGWRVTRTSYEIPWWVVAPLWCAGVWFFTRKMKRNLASMLFGVASLWLFFFMLGKQAFMNYWYLILFALLLAVAATPQKRPHLSAKAETT